MIAPQSGIFALVTSSHAYLEFDLRPEADGRALLAAMAGGREPFPHLADRDTVFQVTVQKHPGLGSSDRNRSRTS